MAIDVCVRVGRRIRYLRSTRGISQLTLAGLSGLSRVNLSRIENGKAEAGLRTLHRIAGALNVKLGELMSTVD
jgi:transcriptional regulator with XRE-family HTH domain